MLSVYKMTTTLHNLGDYTSRRPSVKPRSIKPTLSFFRPLMAPQAFDEINCKKVSSLLITSVFNSWTTNYIWQGASVQWFGCVVVYLPSQIYCLVANCIGCIIE